MGFKCILLGKKKFYSKVLSNHWPLRTLTSFLRHGLGMSLKLTRICDPLASSVSWGLALLMYIPPLNEYPGGGGFLFPSTPRLQCCGSSLGPHACSVSTPPWSSAASVLLRTSYEVHYRVCPSSKNSSVAVTMPVLCLPVVEDRNKDVTLPIPQYPMLLLLPLMVGRYTTHFPGNWKVSEFKAYKEQFENKIQMKLTRAKGTILNEEKVEKELSMQEASWNLSICKGHRAHCHHSTLP